MSQKNRFTSIFAPYWLTIVVSVVLSFCELVFMHTHRFAGEPTKEGLLFNASVFLAHALFWFLPLWAYQIVLRMIDTVPWEKARTALTGCVALLFGIYLIFIFYSWYFYSRTGYFLSENSIRFALNHFSQLQVQLLQTSWQLVLALNCSAIFLSLVFLLVLKTSYQNPVGFRSKWIKISVLLSIMAIALLLFQNRTLLADNPTHPLSAYLSSSKLDQTFFSDKGEIKTKTLFPKKRLIDYGQYDAQYPVIVVMIDSLRGDLASQEPTPTPFMKDLMERTIVFDKAYATASHSNYGDLSVWYSRYPLMKNGINVYRRNDAHRGVSIFKIFKDIGYKTAYISSNNEKWGTMINWLDIPPVDFFFHSEDHEGETWVNEDDTTGLAKLLRSKVATAGKIEDTVTLGVAKKWILGLDDEQPFFLGIQLQNAHFSYLIPDGGPEPFQPATIDFPTVFYLWPKEKIENVKNRYYNAVYNIDLALKDFAGFLKERGIWDKCVFIVIGDSGEAFFEHGFPNHSGPMYDEVMRTYAVIKPPAGEPLMNVEHPVSHIDILPTVLDLLDVPSPSSFQGISALEADHRKNVYMHTNAIVYQDGLVHWPWKLLITFRPKRNVELYNLEQDPKESINLIGNTMHKPTSDRLIERLITWRKIQTQYYSDPQLYTGFSPLRFQ